MEELGIIILAGGKSSRMGEDKGLMPLFGRPMISYVLERAFEIGSDVVIVSNNSNYKQFENCKVVKDEFKEKGPLGGLHAGLKHSKHFKNIVLSCDIPYIKTGLIKYLLYQSDGYDITVAQHFDRLHPLIGIYTKDCQAPFEAKIKVGELKITNAFAGLNFNIVQADEFDEIEFKNLNSKKDIIPM